MPQSAQEYAEITALIKGILNGYPGNSAIFREYIQNSDDAKASSQIFILDERSFPAESVVDPVLRDTQGPALIAVNDGILRDVDWKALRKIHSSSKKSDEGQTGKNGLGFRASYHLTENPHILSGRTLMILDPHQEFEEHPGGVSIDVIDEGPKFQDQLTPFACVVDDVFSEFNGTIFRLPLRTANQARRSEIKDTPTLVKEIGDLLKSFAMSELEQVIIFLKHITSIEVRHIDASGRQSILGKVEIEPLDPSQRLGTVSRTVTLTRHDGSKIVQRWSFHHLAIDKKDAGRMISHNLGYDVEERLTTEKLTPTVDMALPLEGSRIQGRLFTLLPLPIRIPGFALHINAVFALTPDRQSLKNAQEVGLRESRESLLVEWNRTIFQQWVTVAWANILSELPQDLLLSKGWSTWPPEEHDKECYWADIAQNFTMEAVHRNLSIFPTIAHDGTSHLVSLADARVLLASPHPTIFLDLLPPFGLNIVQPLPHIFAIIEPIASTLSAPILSAGSLHKALLEAQDTGFSLSCDAHIATAIVEYLVFSQSTPNLSYVIGLPWFRTAAGVSVAFEPASSIAKYIVPSSEDESNIFSDDPRMLAWASMSDKLRSLLVRPQASKILNVKPLNVDDVISCLVSRFGHFDSSVDEVAQGNLAYVTWLIQFWSWLARWFEKKSFFDKIGTITHLHLLPTSIGSLRKLSAQIIHFRNVNQASIDAWGLLGVYPVHPEIVGDAGLISCLIQQSLAHIPRTSGYIVFLMRSCDSARQPQLSQGALASIRDSLLSGLPQDSRVELLPDEIKKLLSLRIFMVRKVEGSRGLSAATGNRVFTNTDDDHPLPFLPDMQNVIYVDWKDSVTKALIGLVDFAVKVHDHFDLLQLAIDNWDIQSNERQDVWVEKFLDNWRKLPHHLRSKLAGLPFVTVNGISTRVSPNNLIHPRSSLISLYTGEVGKIPVGRFSNSDYLTIMQNLGFVRFSLDEFVVAERLAYLRSSAALNDPHMVQKAKEFVISLDKNWDSTYHSLIMNSRAHKWLPCGSSSLTSPDLCRDRNVEPNAHPYYYDLALTLLEGTAIVSSGFRRALGWSDLVPSHILIHQLRLTIDLPMSIKRNARMEELINYFDDAHTNFSAATLQEMRSVIGDKSWIPVSRTQRETVRTKYALLSESRLAAPFRPVNHSKSTSFLCKMGCTTRPILETLVQELNRPSNPGPEATVSLLQEIAHYHPNFERASILVPTDEPGDEFKTCPLDKIYYRDVSHVYLSTTISGGRAPAHKIISRALAEKLGIEFLSSLVLQDDDDEDDEEQMSEDLVGRIRVFLRDYNPALAINEFLANADDAKATEFSILLNSNVSQARDRVISQEFKSSHGFPSLILYNNSMLSEADFSGLRQVGRGGKTDQQNTHGRHGLGALSLYYFTDVVTVISGEFMMILDPSGKFLPPRRGQKRTALKQRISEITKHHPDQLKPFESVFNFSAKSSKYEGTLFCLPLKSTISETICNYDTITSFIKTTYRDLARNAFLFTRLERISAMERRTLLWEDRVKDKFFWYMSANRSLTSSLRDIFIRHHVTITHQATTSESDHDVRERWLITTSESTEIPPEHRNTAQPLKLHGKMAVQLAIRIDEIEERRESFLFSMLRLPKPTSLPFHVNARFAISSNRQDVVLYPADHRQQSDSKTAFNTWIIQGAVPSLWLATLEHLVHTSDEETGQPLRITHKRWWLCEDGDAIHSLAKRGFFEVLPNADHKIFRTADQRWSSFMESVFSRNEPLRVTHFLRAVKAPVFANMSSHRALSEVPSAKTVDASFVKHTLISHARLPMMQTLYSTKQISIEDIASLLDYICDESPLVSLPVLLLASGELVTIPGLNDAPVYYSKERSHSKLFPSAHFLQEGYTEKVIQHLQSDTSANVAGLTEATIVTLITKELGQCFTDQQRHDWVEEFWKRYKTLPGPPSLSSLENAGLALIKLEGTSRLMSLRECMSHEVIYGRNIPASEGWLVNTLQTMSIEVLNVGENRILGEFFSKRFPHLIDNVLQCIATKGIHRIHGLAETEQNNLSSWIRMKIRDSQDRWRRDGLPSGLTKHTLLQLPIWEAFVNRCKRLQPASDLQVLPSHFSETDLLPYQAPNIAIAALSHSLPEFMRYCRNKTFAYMTSQRIMDVVQLPRTVSGPDIGTYKKFVKSMLRFPVAEIRTVGIRVPDEMGELRPVSQLYDHTMRLFSQTLKFTERSSFIHSQFRDLLTSIRDVGLVHTITFDTFVSCAKAVEVALNPHTQAGTRVDRQSLLEMSDMAFDTYQGSLPALIMLNEALWRVLDNISFVRRKGIRRHGASYVSPERYCSEGALSIVLPPSKFVRQNLEPVVWTQRALFFNEPTAEVLTVNNKLGVPSAGEVVEHLKVLTTQIGHDHPGNLSLLSDIKATYKWLNEHSQEAQEALLLAHDLSIFLNVNDPMTDAWDGQWATAEQLVLDLRYDHKPYKCVRLFLQEYDNLLRAAGSGTLKLFKREAEEGDTSDLGAIRYRESRKAFNEMRKAGKLTDVTFKPSYTGEDDLTVGVADLRAHRIFLAAMIPHFRDSANWMEEPIPFYGTSFGAKTLLDFIYTGEFVLPTIDLESDEELAKLMRDFLELLPIADQWDMPDLKEKIEWSMIHKYDMLQSLPHAHQIMRKVAVECKAQKLEAALDDLTRDNGMLLQHFQD